MNPEFLRLYDLELGYLRERAAALAHYRPETANRLGLSAGNSKAEDSHVERLLEGVAYLAARIHYQLQAGIPQIAQTLVETIYPHFVSPFPACRVVQFQPLPSLAQDYTLPRESELRAVVAGDQEGRHETECRFQTSQSLTIVPLEVVDVSYFAGRAGVFEEIPSVLSSLRFRFRHAKGMPLASLDGVPDLTVYITGQGGSVLSARLYELLVRGSAGCGAFGNSNASPTLIRDLRVEPMGFLKEEALLPTDGAFFQGYRILREFLAFPARFMFFKLAGIGRILSHCQEAEVDLSIGLTDYQRDLEAQVNARQFALNCVPVINLFQKSSVIPINHGQEESEIVPDTYRRLDFEVFKVLSILGNEMGRNSVRVFHPFYGLSDDSRGQSAYFTVRRQARSITRQEIETKNVPSYLGSEVYLSLFDPTSPPFSSSLKSVTAELLCTNRHLPSRLRVGAKGVPPSGCPAVPLFLAEHCAPLPAIIEGDLVWRLISHLSLNYFSLLGGEPDGQVRDARVLRQMLRVYSDFLQEPGSQKEATATQERIDAIHTVKAERVWTMHAEGSKRALIRGLRVTLELKESPLAEVGLYLFGSVLEYYLAHFASINSHIEVVLSTDQRGEIKRWSRKPGARCIL